MGVYKVGNIWYIDYYADGRRIREAVGEKKSEARAALEARKGEIRTGKFHLKNEKRILFEKFADEYIKYAKANKRSWERDNVILKHLKPFFKGISLSKINPKYIEDYKRERLEKVKPATIDRELALLKFMFSLAIKWKCTNENPVKEVKFFNLRRKMERILDHKEAKQLLDAANERLKSILIVALSTGMRRGEIFDLRWNDVDFDKHFIFIKETKSGVPRKVPMNSLVANTIKSIKRESDFVFCNPKTKDSIKAVQTAFKNARERAGIRDFRFHDLRHTAASWMVAAGIDLVTVKEILGHADIKTTMRYAHPTPENKRRAVNALAAILSEKTATNRSYNEKEVEINPFISGN